MNSLLKKTLTMILVSVVLSAVITVLVFHVTGTRAYARIKLDELQPRAAFLADRTGLYMQGFVNREEYAAMIDSDRRVWDAQVYVYNADGLLIIHSMGGNTERDMQLAQRQLAQVLDGETIGAFTMQNGSGAIAGAPITSVYGNIIGAVFLVKPLQELNATLASLIWALVIAMLLSMVIMILPSYFTSLRLTGPLKTMNEAALAMAKGNFSIRAHEKGKDEVAQLGRSLNDLSGTLSSTIGALTFERNRLKSVLDGLGEGVIAVNSYGELTQFNPAAQALLSAGEQLEQSPLYRELVPEIQKVLSGVMEQASAERVQGALTLRFTIGALRGQTGAVGGALILVQDVTEAVRLERTRRDYVANVSHELRTPLASIRSLSDALADGLVKKREDELRYYAYIQRESIRLSRLIDDLLELSRLQSGAVALSKQRMDVGELLEDVVGRYETIAADKGLEMELILPAEMPLSYGNPDRTEQVLIALLDNAIKHNEGGGEILIRAQAREGRIIVSVENGGAIDEADIEHVFERFYKADHAHSGEGTGLGLSISKEIMDLLGERIWAESGLGRVRLSFTLQEYDHSMKNDFKPDQKC